MSDHSTTTAALIASTERRRRRQQQQQQRKIMSPQFLGRSVSASTTTHLRLLTLLFIQFFFSVVFSHPASFRHVSRLDLQLSVRITADDVVGKFLLLPGAGSSSNCPPEVSHFYPFSVEDGQIAHTTMKIGSERCLDGYSTVVYGTDSGSASAAVEEGAKELVNDVLTSDLPAWFAHEPNGRVCGPAGDPDNPNKIIRNRFRPGTILIFVKPDRIANIAGLPVDEGRIYMFTSSLDEQCFYSKPAVSVSLTPLPTTSPSKSPKSPTTPDDLVTSTNDPLPPGDEDDKEDDEDDKETGDGAGGSNTASNGPVTPPSPSSTPRPPTFAAPASSTPEVDGASSNEGPACFGGSAIVTLSNGRRMAMRDLSIGDVVVVGPFNMTSQVFAFSHRDASAKPSDFVRLVTDSSSYSISLSAGHYIYANMQLTAAKNVRVGDKVSVTTPTADDIRYVTVTQVLHGVSERGLYNPQTLHGDIVVDGIVASTYTLGVKPQAALALLAPIRALFQVSARQTQSKLKVIGWVEKGPLAEHLRRLVTRLLAA